MQNLYCKSILFVTFCLLLTISFSAWAQTTVKGTVTDAATNEGLPGVAVLVKPGNTGGTITTNNNNSIDITWNNSEGGTVTVTATTLEGCAETNTLMVTTNAAYCCTFEQVYQPAYDIPYGNSGTITTWADVSNPWNSNTVYINDDINIYGKLIINMTLRFGPNGRIVVHPGGVLTLQNAQLSGDDRCSTMWHGIRVLGPGINQKRVYGNDISAPNNFGYLKVENNVLISDAVVAIAANDLPKFDMTHIVANINNYIQEDENQLTTLPAVNLNDMYYTPLAISTAGGVVEFGNTGVNTDPSSMTTRIFNCFDGVFFGLVSTNCTFSASA
jgi:hypothetical protein